MPPTDVPIYLQYGSFGLVVLLVIYGGRFLARTADTVVIRALASFDRLDATMDRVDAALGRAERDAASRHTESSEGIRRLETRMAELERCETEARIAAEQRHAAILTAIEAAAKETRHATANALQPVSIAVQLLTERGGS